MRNSVPLSRRNDARPSAPVSISVLPSAARTCTVPTLRSSFAAGIGGAIVCRGMERNTIAITAAAASDDAVQTRRRKRRFATSCCHA